jgi:hypothetical protein
MSRRLLRGSALFALTSLPLLAQIIWDPTAEFSITNGNPNGVWTYGWMDLGFSTFTPYTTHGTNNWYGWGGDQTPTVWLNDTGTTAYGVPPGDLSIHPGNGTEPSVLRWTAPATYDGPVQVNGQFLAGDGGIMQVAVRLNGTVLWNAVDAGAFNLNVTVHPSDTLDFAVFGGYAYGNTPLQLNLVGIPEPSAFALLALGLAALRGVRFSASQSQHGQLRRLGRHFVTLPGPSSDC